MLAASNKMDTKYLICAFPSCNNKDGILATEIFPNSAERSEIPLKLPLEAADSQAKTQSESLRFATKSIDKKYFFCSKIHKYNMVKSLHLCKKCDNYSNNNENICDDCIAKTKFCTECEKSLNSCEKKIYCEICITQNKDNFILCDYQCYHHHLHVLLQNNTSIIKTTDLGCGHIFPTSDYYKCLQCYDKSFCSYECLKEHYLAYIENHKHLVCFGCKVILQFLDKKYYCSNDCCKFCSKECAMKLEQESRCCGCCCRRCINNLCNNCSDKYCIECFGRSVQRCNFSGKEEISDNSSTKLSGSIVPIESYIEESDKLCKYYLCNKEKCLNKHNIKHILEAENICANKGCFVIKNTEYNCNCGIEYCSNTCKEEDNKNSCDNCGCSHKKKLCHIKKCQEYICRSCKVICNKCVTVLEANQT